MSIKISDLIKLIETCSKAGVKRFSHDAFEGSPLQLDFFETPKPFLEIPQQIQEKDKVPCGTYGGAIDTKIPLAPMGPVDIDPEFSRQEALRLLQEDFDNLQIEDPEKYEELLAFDKLGDYGENHA